MVGLIVVWKSAVSDSDARKGHRGHKPVSIFEVPVHKFKGTFVVARAIVHGNNVARNHNIGSATGVVTVYSSADGTVKNDGTRTLDAKEKLKMDWLCENVIGKIPTFDQILPMSRTMVRELGIYRDSIPAEKEGASREAVDRVR